MQYVLVLVFGALSVAAASVLSRPAQRSAFIAVTASSFVLRLLMHVFVMRDMAFFSHGAAGGDCFFYEMNGEVIAAMWQLDGIRYVTAADFPDVKGTSLICNLYAAIIYVCGHGCALACTALVALLACVLCLVIYRFALELGASDRVAFGTAALTFGSPSFIYHTSDMYKDGINALLVVSALYLAFGLAKRFSLVKVALLVAALAALWGVRAYMVFLCAMPLPIALLGTQRGFSFRKVVMALVFVAAAVAMVAYGGARSVSAEAGATFERATDADVRGYNVINGASGVTFEGDDGSPWSAIGPKLLYTVFSPFPWMGGSIGLQLGKIDTLAWYYVLFSAAGAARLMWARDRRTLLMMLLFLVSGFVAYATTMANVGLIFRQRMPLVMVTTVLASVYWTHRARARRAGPARAPLAAVRA
jgi:hypothetical protein